MLPRSRARVLRALNRVNEFLTADDWCRNAPGLDEFGRPIDPLAETAHQFCIQGALIRLAPDLEGPAFRMAMTVLHMSARAVSKNRYTDLFAMNDDPSTSFDEIKNVLRVTIETIANGRSSPLDIEAMEVHRREMQRQTTLDAWVMARTYGNRQTLTVGTLAAALCHAGQCGYARISRDGEEARDANTLLASQLFVRLILQLGSPGQLAKIAPYRRQLADHLPPAWYKRIVEHMRTDESRGCGTADMLLGSGHQSAMANN